MRISDWSSDVCSSDLGDPDEERKETVTQPAAQPELRKGGHRPGDGVPRPAVQGKVPQAAGEPRKQRTQAECRFEAQAGSSDVTKGRAAEDRSEEHTSVLQSLMRISYAVFFLKKKNISYLF